jgi:hypothetical protein
MKYNLDYSKLSFFCVTRIFEWTDRVMNVVPPVYEAEFFFRR